MLLCAMPWPPIPLPAGAGVWAQAMRKVSPAVCSAGAPAAVLTQDSATSMAMWWGVTAYAKGEMHLGHPGALRQAHRRACVRVGWRWQFPGAASDEQGRSRDWAVREHLRRQA